MQQVVQAVDTDLDEVFAHSRILRAARLSSGWRAAQPR